MPVRAASARPTAELRPLEQGHPPEVGWSVLRGEAPTLGTEVSGEDHRC
jgi:hypothetical protein